MNFIFVALGGVIGAVGYCSLYVLLSVVGCVIGVWSGKKIATKILL